MNLLAVIVPEVHGALELIFLGLLLLLLAAVGVFALYVIVQQFRNPGRAPRRL
jgi:hypothetical protein